MSFNRNHVDVDAPCKQHGCYVHVGQWDGLTGRGGGRGGEGERGRRGEGGRVESD